MAEKLTAAAWNAFAKKKELDDGAFVKALGKYEALDEAKHDARLDALADVVAQANKLVTSLPKKKPPLPDKEQKEVKDKLHAFIDSAEKAQKDVRADKAAAEAQAEEEADSPALLTSKMVPLIRELRKGEAQMPVMVANASKSSAVLIMRRGISPSRRKLMADYLQTGSGLKYFTGHCLQENGVLTFVLQGSAGGGLAKRLRQAVLDQTGLRLKLRVRSDDGADEDGEDEAEANVAGDAPPAPPLPPGMPGGQAGQGGQGDETAGSDTAQRWQKRWGEVRPALDRVLQQGGHPADAKLRAVMAFAVDKADKGDPAAALKALDTLVQLLRQTAAPGPAPGVKVAPAIVYTQSRLAWVATRGKIKGELDKLEQSILAHYQGKAALPEVVRSVRKLDSVLQTFDEGLADRLDNALNATDPQEKSRWHDEARQLIEQYQAFLAGDNFVKELDTNPFVPVAVRATLETTLKTLAAKMV